MPSPRPDDPPPRPGGTADRAAWHEAAWHDDAALLADLGEALHEPEQVPDAFLTAARAALTWRTVDDELTLAELRFDSACDPAPAGLTRSGTGVRLLAFRGGEVGVEIEVGPEGIVGQLTPGHAGRVHTEAPTGVVEATTADQAGFFTLGPPPAGPVRLAAQTPAHRFVTSWVSLA